MFSKSSLAVLACLFALSALVTGATPPSVAVETDVELAAPLSAFDVRWESEGSLLVAAARGGVRRITPEGAELGVVSEYPASRIGQGDGFILAGTPLALSCIPAKSCAANPVREFASLVDVDAADDRIAFLGAARGDEQGLASDGVIAWSGPRSTELKPLMRGRTSPGGKDMARCGILELGAIRVLEGGSTLVYPGIEPGLYQYAADGKLLRAWQTDSLGIVDDCSMTDEEVALLARDFARRTEWFAARTIVEDVLPLDRGPALLLRHVRGGKTFWELAILSDSGAPRRLALPLSFPTPRAHARADVRGDRVALVAADMPLPGRKPGAAARVIVFKLEP
jgi:hypothetical protein